MKSTAFLFTAFLLLYFDMSYSQRVIQMTNNNGIFQIPCAVNGIPMKFIFDTGASDVSISSTEALFLIKQGLLTNDDLLEKVEYQIANGDLITGTKINIKEIDIDGIKLRNVRATIIENQTAPLLLGQSAIEKIGKYTIENGKLILLDYPPKNKSVEKVALSGAEKVDKDALEYLNSFLSQKNWAGNWTGELKYIAFNSTFEFTSNKIIENPINNQRDREISVSWSVKSENIKEVVEVIAKNKNDSKLVVFYDITLFEPINTRNMLMLKTGELPEQNSDPTDRLNITLEKSVDPSQIESVQNAIRLVFPSSIISTKKYNFD